MLTQKLNSTFKKEVSIDYLGLRIPMDLEIKDLRIEGLANIDYVYASVSPFGLLKGKIIINKAEVSKPEIYWEIGVPTDRAVKQIMPGVDKILSKAKEIIDLPKEDDIQSTPDVKQSLIPKKITIDFTRQMRRHVAPSPQR